MPGKRKFRLSNRKNYERKKYQVSELVVRIPRKIYESNQKLVISIPRKIFQDANVENLLRLYERVCLTQPLPENWSFILNETKDNLLISRSYPYGLVAVTIDNNCRARIAVNGIQIDSKNSPVGDIECVNCINMLLRLLQKMESLRPCIGNPDKKFHCIRDSRKGKFKDHTGTRVVAYFDEKEFPSSTIRHSDCSMLTHNDRCQKCDEFRSNLNSLLSRAKKRTNHESAATNLSSHLNYKYLSTPEKIDRIRSLKSKNRSLELKNRRLQFRLTSVIEKDSVTLDGQTSTDINQIMEDEDEQISSKYPENSFPLIFWKTQKELSGKKGNSKKGVRWHPLIIKWCLYLRHQSSKAYETLRQSGISLPSQRTLRDYSNAVKAGSGFSVDVDHQILEAAKLIVSPDYHRLVILLIDEMHLKEDLVYNKHAGQLIGFVDLGDINNHLSRFERSLYSDNDEDLVDTPPLAKSMVAFMVRGLFTNFSFTYAQFPCVSLTGEQMFSPFWKCVGRLERIGFKVLGATFDGASVNRRLVSIHDPSNTLPYRVRNLYAEEERYIYFISDPPHLIKTVRNCWSSKNRCLWNNGKEISWQHLIDLYQTDHGKGSGLSLVPKLKYEHVYLTAFSKMRVDLAAQALSESVAKAIEISGGVKAEETARFIKLFDKFFDVLNVSNFNNWAKHRKPAQKPYYKPDDERLKWLKEEFLVYLDSWEESVRSRQGMYTEAQRKRMLLSTETLIGIRRTVKSFLELVPFILSLPEVRNHNLSFLSQNICQDPLENFFGCQRQRGGTSDNPSVSNFYDNTQALRVVDSFCRGPVRGNCRGSNVLDTSNTDVSTPLRKRPRN